MPHLICYDITNNSLRTRMSKKIIAKGFDRINKSVYLGLGTQPTIQSLERELSMMIQKKNDPNDSLIIISVSHQQLQRMRIYGKNDLDKAELLGEKSTLIL
ncbi:MAG: CRISPR-associated endonuclease Cas2 [Saprospiraceae bacterium]